MPGASIKLAPAVFFEQDWREGLTQSDLSPCGLPKSHGQERNGQVKKTRPHQSKLSHNELLRLRCILAHLRTHTGLAC